MWLIAEYYIEVQQRNILSQNNPTVHSTSSVCTGMSDVNRTAVTKLHQILARLTLFPPCCFYVYLIPQKSHHTG